MSKKEKAKYIVYVKGFAEKEYKYKIQAIIYCFLNGYIFTDGRNHFLHQDVEIEKIVSLGDYLKRNRRVERKS